MSHSGVVPGLLKLTNAASTPRTGVNGTNRSRQSYLQHAEKTMGVTFPNETPRYREARAALLKREVALRREMEAVAALLRTLPPGGEVPEDYSFDSIGEGGAPSTVRLSELFRGGDTLMLYHYMFPRHAEDRRPGPTRGATAQAPLA